MKDYWCSWPSIKIKINPMVNIYLAFYFIYLLFLLCKKRTLPNLFGSISFVYFSCRIGPSLFVLFGGRDVCVWGLLFGIWGTWLWKLLSGIFDLLEMTVFLMQLCACFCYYSEMWQHDFILVVSYGRGSPGEVQRLYLHH